MNEREYDLKEMGQLKRGKYIDYRIRLASDTENIDDSVELIDPDILIGRCSRVVERLKQGESVTPQQIKIFLRDVYKLRYDALDNKLLDRPIEDREELEEYPIVPLDGGEMNLSVHPHDDLLFEDVMSIVLGIKIKGRYQIIDNISLDWCGDDDFAGQNPLQSMQSKELDTKFTKYILFRVWKGYLNTL